MTVKEIPTNFRVYYRLFIDDNKAKIEASKKAIADLKEDIEVKHNNIKAWSDVYKNEFKVNLDKYEEFTNNKYTTGNFYRMAKGLFINKQNDYELVTDTFNLFELASKQKELYDLEKDIEFYTKCSNVSIKDYTEMLRIFYTEVHKKMVLEGYGYSFGHGIGWICVNRCVFKRKKPILDYAATRRREKELKEQGKRIYNKEEADWCLRNGIKYEAEDKRVFVCNEYCYQVPLISCTLTDASMLEFKITDYRHKRFRGKTNEQIIAECNNDTSKICELELDLKTKVTLCDKADKILYTKFIRNENQEPIAFAKINRKD